MYEYLVMYLGVSCQCRAFKWLPFSTITVCPDHMRFVLLCCHYAVTCQSHPSLCYAPGKLPLTFQVLAQASAATHLCVTNSSAGVNFHAGFLHYLVHISITMPSTVYDIKISEHLFLQNVSFLNIKSYVFHFSNQITQHNA